MAAYIQLILTKYKLTATLWKRTTRRQVTFCTEIEEYL